MNTTRTAQGGPGKTKKERPGLRKQAGALFVCGA